MIYALVGPNTHAIRQRIAAIRESHTQDAPIIRLDGEAADVGEIMQAVGGQSLFESANFVIVQNLSKNKTARDKLSDITEAVAEDSVLILVESDVDKRISYYKQLKKLPNFEEFSQLNPGMAAEFVKHFAQQHGGDISNTDAMYLVSRLGADQGLLAAELEKLLLYDNAITKQTIEQLTEPSFQDTVFQLVDALSAGDKNKAHAIYDGLRRQQVHPLEVLGTLNWQIHTLVQIKAAGTMPVYALAREAGLAPFVVEKNMKLVQRLSMAQLNQLIDAAITADQHLKTTSLDPDDVVETLLLEIAEIIS